MNNGVHEFSAADNGHGSNGAYHEPMTDAYVVRDSLPQIIWRGRLFIVLLALVGLGAAYGYLRVATPKYMSVSRLLVEKPNVRAPYDGPQPAGTSSANYLQTQASLITGREIIAATLRDPNVLSLPTFRGAEHPVEEVLKTLSASVGRNVDIISVRAESAYPDDAALMVNAVVQAYIHWHQANRQVGTADLLRDLNDQLTRRYQELRTKRKERMMFEQRNPEVAESAGGGVISTTIDLLRQDLAEARLAAAQMSSYHDGLQRFQDEPEKLRQYVYSHHAGGGTPSEAKERTLIEEELFRTQLQLQELSDTANTSVRLSHKNVLENREKNYRERIAKLDTEFVAKQVAMAKTLLEDAQAREKQLTEMYEKEFAKVQSLSGQDSEYTFIVSECQMLEDLCESLLNQINALDLSARLEGLTIRVLEQAMPATEPFSPKFATTLVMGSVLGLMAGVGLAFLLNWRDQSLRSADEITAMLGVRVLGTVPCISRRRLPNRTQDLHLAPDSRESEAVRAIRTALLYSTGHDRAVTTLVTSPSSLEGKTTLVRNLGIAMAQAGQKVLIVDADLRKPMHNRIFSTSASQPGLSNVLAGEATLEEAIRPTDIPGLDVLEGGQSVQNGTGRIEGSVFEATLEQLENKYDRILVDSPPVGEVTDTQILAACCDLTLLVLRAETSKRIPTQQARDALVTVGARIAGVVVNDVSKRNNRYSHYRMYSPQYIEHSNGVSNGNGSNGNGSNGHGSNGNGSNGHALPTEDNGHSDETL